MPQEEQEFEALISLVEEAALPTDDVGINMNEYGSEDEYDRLCTQLILKAERGDSGTNGFPKSETHPGQEMDTSMD